MIWRLVNQKGCSWISEPCWERNEGQKLRTTLSRFLKPGREQKVSERASSSSATSSSSQTPADGIRAGKGTPVSREHTVSAGRKKTKLRMVAVIIDDFAYVSGERGRSKDASTILCAFHAVLDVYLAE